MKARKRSGDPTKLLLILALAISLLTPWTDLPASSPVSGICFDPAWGKIEGVVTAAGKPFPAIVRVKSIRSSPVKIEIEALTDSLGHYTIIVPHGSYCIDVTGRSGSARFPYSKWLQDRELMMWDTLHVKNEVTRADIHCGRLIVRLEIPENLLGQRLTCNVQTMPRPGLAFRDITTEQIQESPVEFLFPLLPPENYLVSVQSDSVPTTWLPPAYDWSAAEFVLVKKDQITMFNSALPKPAHISGVIRGSWTTLQASPPDFLIYQTESRPCPYRFRTGQDGRFNPNPAKNMS